MREHGHRSDSTSPRGRYRGCSLLVDAELRDRPPRLPMEQIHLPVNIDPSFDETARWRAGLSNGERDPIRGQLDTLDAAILACKDRLDALAIAPHSVQLWRESLDMLDDCHARSRELSSVAECLAASRGDQTARANVTQSEEREGRWEELETRLGSIYHSLNDSAKEALHREVSLADWRAMLSSLDRQAGHRLPTQLEILASRLGNDGLHAWSRFYFSRVSAQRFRLARTSGGDTESCSRAEVVSALRQRNRRTRRLAHEAAQESWRSSREDYAMALNHILGARWTLNSARSLGALDASLQDQRLSAAALEAMCASVERFSKSLADYIARRGRWLGVKKSQWYDLQAPLAPGRKWTFATAHKLITAAMEKVHPVMAEFCDMALRRGWVDESPRPGKQSMAFCAHLPRSKVSRISMNFDGSPQSVRTLAHELGHAYHNWVLRDMPMSRQRRVPCLSESAGIFSELVVQAYALRTAPTETERLSWLDRSVGDATSYLMNTMATFRFEQAAYEERGRGEVFPERFCELMVDSQRRAYADALASWDPYLWASRPHFYMPKREFYNFPYCVGFLVATRLYGESEQNAQGFAPRLDRFLVDAGHLDTDDLLARNLGGSPGTTDFWDQSLEPIRRSLRASEDLLGRCRPGGAGPRERPAQLVLLTDPTLPMEPHYEVD